MKQFLFSLLFLFSAAFAQQKIPVENLQLDFVYDVGKGSTLFESNLFSNDDSVFAVQGKTVFVRLSKRGNALLSLTKENGIYIGRFFKKDSIYYELKRNGSNYFFEKRDVKSLIQNCYLPTVFDNSPAFLSTFPKVDSDSALVAAGYYVCFIDLDGANVNSPYWNGGTPFYATPFTYYTNDSCKNYILQSVKQSFLGMSVVITFDSVLYNRANTYNRQHLIVTAYSAWYGSTGGVSYVGSGRWGMDIPNFVFSSLLANNIKYIESAISHEFGHSFNLQHHSAYNDTCGFVNEYDPGPVNNTQIGYCPIMGNSYFRNMPIWWNGSMNLACDSLQNDLYIMLNYSTTVFGQENDLKLHYRVDDGGDNWYSARTGIPDKDYYQQINKHTDSDYFKITITDEVPWRFTVIPFNHGGDTLRARLKLGMRILNEDLTVFGVYDDPLKVGVNVVATLPTGKYYVIVYCGSTALNPSGYGYMGSYKFNYHID